MVNRALLFQRLFKLLATSFAEGIGIAVAAISGFLVVHALPKEIYGEYTFLVACVALIVGLSDLGLSHCYLPIVGSRAAETSWVLGACRRVYRKRWWLLMPAVVLVLPYWFYISIHHEWLDGVYLAASAAAALGIVLTLREQVNRALLAILRKVALLNRLGVFASCIRLGLIVLALWLVPSHSQLAWLMAAVVAGTSIALAMYLRVPELSAFQNAQLNGEENRFVDGRVRDIMKPLAFPMLVYQFQGVITIFLVSLLGTVGSVAEVGALTRPALILSLVDRVSGILLFPAIAACAPGKPLLRLILRSHAVYLLAMAVLLASSIFLPQFWILLIGEQYQAQQGILWIAFLGAILNNGAGFAFTTLSVRGYTRWQAVCVPIGLAVQILYLAILGAATTATALGLGVAAGALNFLFQYFLLGYLLFLKLPSLTQVVVPEIKNA